MKRSGLRPAGTNLWMGGKAARGSLGLVVAVGLVLAAPLLKGGFPAHGFDTWIHCSWASQFSRQFWAGEVYPRWLPEFNGGLGSPAFFYYGPGPYWVTALAWRLFPDDRFASRSLGVAAGLALVMSGLFTWWWLRPWMGPWAAAGGAVGYMLVPYHLAAGLYLRGAFAEFWGMVWLPAVLGSVDRLRRGGGRAVAALAFSYAALILSHLPTTLVFSAVPLAYAAAVELPGQRRERIVRVLIGMGLGTGLAAVYLVPAVALQEAVCLERLRELYPYRRFFFLRDWDPPFKALLFWMVLSMIVAAGCGLAVGWQRADPAAKRLARFCAALSVVCLLMMTPFSQPVWALLPVLQLVQFPWRFGTVLSVAVAALLAVGLAQIRSRWHGWKLAAATALWAVAVGWFYWTFEGAWPCWRQILPKEGQPALWDVPEYRPRVATASVEAVLARFEPRNGSSGRVAFARGEGWVQVELWAPRRLALGNVANQSCSLLLRQYYYPGWKAWLDGRPHPVHLEPDDGVLRLDLPGGVHAVDLRLTATVAERLGRAISIAAAAVTLVLGLRCSKVAARPSGCSG